MGSLQMNPLSPKKLLLSKWTAVQPLNKEKHFLVSKVIYSDPEQELIAESVELEAVYSKKIRIIPWRELTDSDYWLQGWK
jgi:tryptophan-rich hypothetical protein